MPGRHHRQLVVDFVIELFGADHVETAYHSKTADPEGVSVIDALVTTARPLAIAAVPNDLAAERAIGTKYMIGSHLDERTRWVAVPRDLQKLSAKTQTRLLRSYIPAAPSFLHDRDTVRARLTDFAA